MSENEIALLVLVISCIGGGWGARMGSEPFWKGFLVIAVATGGCYAAMTLANSTNAFLNFILTVVIAGVAGGMMRMTGRQIASVLLGAIVILIPVFVIAGLVASG